MCRKRQLRLLFVMEVQHEGADYQSERISDVMEQPNCVSKVAIRVWDGAPNILERLREMCDGDYPHVDQIKGGEVFVVGALEEVRQKTTIRPNRHHVMEQSRGDSIIQRKVEKEVTQFQAVHHVRIELTFQEDSSDGIQCDETRMNVFRRCPIDINHSAVGILLLLLLGEPAEDFVEGPVRQDAQRNDDGRPLEDSPLGKKELL